MVMFTCNEGHCLFTCQKVGEHLSDQDAPLLMYLLVRFFLWPVDFRLVLKISLFVKLCDQQSVSAFSRRGLEQKNKPDNTFSDQLTCVCGD